MGLADRIRIMRGHLTPEEVAERDAAARVRREKAERQAEQRRQYQDATAAQQSQHRDRLERCGSLSILELVCHRDTWSFIRRWMNQANYGHEWWSSGGVGNRITNHAGGDMLTIRLSGPQTGEVIERMAMACKLAGVTPHPGVAVSDQVDAAIAGRIYDRIGAILDLIDLDNPSTEPVPPVVLDDRPRAAPRLDDEQLSP